MNGPTRSSGRRERAALIVNEETRDAQRQAAALALVLVALAGIFGSLVAVGAYVFAGLVATAAATFTMWRASMAGGAEAEVALWIAIDLGATPFLLALIDGQSTWWMAVPVAVLLHASAEYASLAQELDTVVFVDRATRRQRHRLLHMMIAFGAAATAVVAVLGRFDLGRSSTAEIAIIAAGAATPIVLMWATGIIRSMTRPPT